MVTKKRKAQAKPKKSPRGKTTRGKEAQPKKDDARAEFVERYSLHHNAARAVEESGFNVKNSASYGWRLLQDEAIQRALNKCKAKRARENKITRDQIISEYKSIGFAKRNEMSEWNAEGVKFNVSDKTKALDSLSKMLGFDTPEDNKTDIEAVIRLTFDDPEPTKREPLNYYEDAAIEEISGPTDD